ncbi:MAG: tetraacyldisaccharide 4'-kinase [Candidatus Eisenbacteria bacterium]|nr:tetraacyldisaccharide 4'-kinase [Candidatus Eisenbacteria bacterium]
MSGVERRHTRLRSVIIGRWSEIATGRREARGASAVLLGLLVLLSVPYGIATAITQWVRAGRSSRLDVPVISVGNLVVGGTGKTPLVIYLARLLGERGRKVAIASRGYGRRERGMVVVSEGGRPLVGWEHAGDEPVLIAMLTKGVSVVVCADRLAAARYAVDKLGADAILVDDGFQHVRLARDLDIVAADATRPVGNGHLLPGGTLRESPLAVGRADVIVATRCGSDTGFERVEATLGALAPELPVVATRMIPAEFWNVSTGAPVNPRDVRRHRCLALSSIASPTDFERTLKSVGVETVARMSFPDHHRYTESDHASALELARARGADMIMTTEKDAVRLSAWRPPIPLVALGIELEVLSGGEALERAVERALESGGANGP